jgi:preprotein translocase subunit SecA
LHFKLFILSMSIITKIFGDPNEKVVKSLLPIVEKINKLEAEFEKLSDEELRAKTEEFRQRLKVSVLSPHPTLPLARGGDPKFPLLTKEGVGGGLDEILPEAFAAAREAAKRALGQRHYDVQLIGGIVLHRGQIAEMRTGEGKTLVATLPLYLNALTGRGAHLVTVNDYLSRLGAGWMGPVYHLLGISIGVIVHEASFVYDPVFTDDKQYDERMKHFRPCLRKEAYGCDITYGTNNEFGFDYLRDNMAPSLEQMVQRNLNYAIVDEVDSILIDEARTPLIISAPAEESTDKYYKFSELVGRLTENEDYNIDEKMRAATLTEAGITTKEKWLGGPNIYTAGGIREVHHIEQALKARVLFKLDRDYVVREGEVIIVDEFTGRLMFGRRYSDGLHQAIEAKEGVKIQRESQTLATITFQNYFRMYKKLAGMTGTAVTEAEEFYKIYNLETTVIPTHRPMIREDLNDLIYRVEEGKFRAVIEEVKRRHEAGQPVLVGTISIEKNELLIGMMEREGLNPQVLNAKNHEKEAQIIAQAGKLGAITIATNMAGRGVDIMLGGVEPTKSRDAKFCVSTESESVETHRNASLQYNDEYVKWKTEHAKVVELGGLHVIGTERHESRRIDNQLRGRAGRQGDAGSSQFYVSCEDDLMRIFGGDRMKAMMSTLRVPEDMPIENRIISRSIESAQKKVEGNNFDIRKHLVEYDDVLNKHREAIYRKRKEILNIAEQYGKKVRDEEITNHQEAITKQIPNPQFQIPNSLSDIILQMVENEIEQVISFHTAGEDIKDWNLNEIREVVYTIFPVGESLKNNLEGFTADGNKLDKANARTNIINYLVKSAKDKYGEMGERAEKAGLDWLQIEKSILIRSIDMLWIEHLEAISSLRQGIGLRGYGQRDPLVEYKKEAYGLYNELNNLIQKEVVYSIYKIGDLQEMLGANNLAEKKMQFSAPAKEMDKGSSSFSGFAPMSGKGDSGAGQKSFGHIKQKVKDTEGKKIGRNDPCPCGAKKLDGTPVKFKHCHGK